MGIATLREMQMIAMQEYVEQVERALVKMCALKVKPSIAITPIGKAQTIEHDTITCKSQMPLTIFWVGQ